MPFRIPPRVGPLTISAVRLPSTYPSSPIFGRIAASMIDYERIHAAGVGYSPFGVLLRHVQRIYGGSAT